MGTIRLPPFKVAARVVVTTRRVMFHLASSDPYRAVFEAVYARLTGRAPGPAAGGAERVESEIARRPRVEVRGWWAPGGRQSP